MDTSSFVTDSGGVQIPKGSGVVSLGTYSSLPSFGGTVNNSDVTVSYLELSSGVFDSPFAFDGFYRFDLDVNIPNSFNNQEIYVVLGDGSTVENSDNLLVWKPTANPDGNVFVEDNPIGGPGSILLNNDNGDLLLGSFDSGSNTFAMSSVSAIPEPSSLVLTSLALFTLTGRRSRK